MEMCAPWWWSACKMTTIWWLSIKRLLARFNHHHMAAEAVTLTTIRSSAENNNGPRCSSAVIVCVWTKSSSLSQRWAGGQRERAGGSRAEQWSIVGFSYFTEKKCQATTKKCSITASRCCLSLCSLFCIFYIFCIHNNFSTHVVWPGECSVLALWGQKKASRRNDDAAYGECKAKEAQR